jgi:hypothetical protein
MPEGVIYGGWSFVAAAYVITAIGLGVYAASLILRLRKARVEE